MTAPYEATPTFASGGAQPVRARAALVTAGLVIVLSLAGTVFSYLLPSVVYSLDLPTSSYSLLFLPFQIAEIVLAIVAIVLAVGPLRGGGPKGTAGAALGIGIAWLAITLFSLAIGPLLGLVL